MKCEKCGAEIPEGMLYCENCGNEIHIVPDFEPEVESSISESISHIAQDVMGDVSDTPKADRSADLKGEKAADTGKTGTRRKRIIISVLAFVALLLIIGAAFGIRANYRYRHSYDYYLQIAREESDSGDLDDAILSYLHAMELDHEDLEVAFELAEVYYNNSNLEEYEAILKWIAQNERADAYQQQRAFVNLIEMYLEREDYVSADEVLRQCEIDSVLDTYGKYLASEPVFNYEEGYYETGIPLKMTSSSPGEIRYTLDGSDPDENSLLFDVPVLLTQSTCVKAVFISEYGVMSPVAVMEYEIEAGPGPGPDISVVSGSYNIPVLIEVVGSGENVYYTTNGKDPDLNSAMYTSAIHMPIGVSEFCFAYIDEDGSSSEVTRCTYELTFEGSCSVIDAENAVMQVLLETGRTIDAEGHIAPDSEEKYVGVYQYVTDIDDMGYFYVFAEMLEDENGERSMTGTNYAVNIYSLDCYILKDMGDNDYALESVFYGQEDADLQDAES